MMNGYIEAVTLFGSTAGECDTKFRRRIGLAKEAFQMLSSVLRDRKKTH